MTAIEYNALRKVQGMIGAYNEGLMAASELLDQIGEIIDGYRADKKNEEVIFIWRSIIGVNDDSGK